MEGIEKTINVEIRIKPSTENSIEIQGNTLSLGTKTYTFNRIHLTTTQNQLYKNSVEPLVQNFIAGYNCTVFAYGQTGSGKTYTMGISDSDVTGIVPQVLSRLCEMNVEMSCTFIEIYNEDVIDLLVDHKIPLAVREVRGEVVVAGATETDIKSLSDGLDVLRRGCLERTTKSTKMNLQSSRSHAIFTLFMRREIDGNFVTSKFSFVDLAGSERLKRTMCVGQRARESISINSGLLALGNVISALYRKAKHVPFRDSKLTRILQSCLNGHVLMIACVSSAHYDMNETHNTLKYANRAASIQTNVKMNIEVDGNKRVVLMLKKEIQKLKSENQILRERIRKSSHAQVEDLVKENRHLKSQLENIQYKEDLDDNSEDLAQKILKHPFVQNLIEENQRIQSELNALKGTTENRVLDMDLNEGIESLDLDKNSVLMENKTNEQVESHTDKNIHPFIFKKTIVEDKKTNNKNSYGDISNIETHTNNAIETNIPIKPTDENKYLNKDPETENKMSKSDKGRVFSYKNFAGKQTQKVEELKCFNVNRLNNVNSGLIEENIRKKGAMMFGKTNNDLATHQNKSKVESVDNDILLNKILRENEVVSQFTNGLSVDKKDRPGKANEIMPSDNFCEKNRQSSYKISNSDNNLVNCTVKPQEYSDIRENLAKDDACEAQEGTSEYKNNSGSNIATSSINSEILKIIDPQKSYDQRSESSTQESTVGENSEEIRRNTSFNKNIGKNIIWKDEENTKPNKKVVSFDLEEKPIKRYVLFTPRKEKIHIETTVLRRVSGYLPYSMTMYDKKLIFSSIDNRVRLWDEKVIEIFTDNGVRCLESGDGLVYYTTRMVLKQFDMRSGSKPLCAYKSEVSTIKKIDNLVYTGHEDGTLSVLDVRNMKFFVEKVHAGTIFSIEKVGSNLYTGSRDHTVKCINDGIVSLSPPHFDSVHVLLGYHNQLISLGRDCSLKRWSGTKIVKTVPYAHDSWIKAGIVLDDCFVSGSKNGTLRFWDFCNDSIFCVGKTKVNGSINCMYGDGGSFYVGTQGKEILYMSSKYVK